VSGAGYRLVRIGSTGILHLKLSEGKPEKNLKKERGIANKLIFITFGLFIIVLITPFICTVILLLYTYYQKKHLPILGYSDFIIGFSDKLPLFSEVKSFTASGRFFAGAASFAITHHQTEYP